MLSLTRRQALRGAAAVGAVTMLGDALSTRRAAAATAITAVEWGGDVVNAMKQIEAKQSAVKVNWVLHQGGSGAILPKIKASWPHPEYDYVAGWEGSFNGMVKEDWLVPVTVDSVPNLKDIPQKIIVKNAKGDWEAVPRAVGGIYAAYRKDICPIEVKSIDDLFDPKLKGKICWPGPTQAMMLPLVALSLHAGGNEKNMDPGFALMKKLAQSGNIGRVGVTDTDFSTSLTSGETALGFYSEPQLTAVAKSFPLVRLTKQKGVPCFLYQSGFAVMKNRPNTEATLAFINHCISPEMSSLYAEVAGEAPLNVKAKTPDALKHLAFTPEEFDEYVYVPDFNVVLDSQDAWSKRWENEIAPLL
ncbi:MAG TPA: substrate-binding domain-containing protein [Candidatus Polarisedimenticolia bacterium]|nr:substrate-binding domain-containing protein [Candidatus Polarisedimenticolia bacterium]